jgi:hypothetical protein
MAFTIIEQYSRDIDYYVFHRKLGLLHFASAGGRLPRIIESNDELMTAIHGEVIESPNRFEYELNPNLQRILNIESDQVESYSREFIEMAKRGLLSFDRTYINDPEDQTYHLVAWPKEAREDPFLFFEVISRLENNNLIFNKSYIPFERIPQKNEIFQLRID